jgi:hypothetical protein
LSPTVNFSQGDLFIHFYPPKSSHRALSVPLAARPFPPLHACTDSVGLSFVHSVTPNFTIFSPATAPNNATNITLALTWTITPPSNATTPPGTPSNVTVSLTPTPQLLPAALYYSSPFPICTTPVVSKSSVS